MTRGCLPSSMAVDGVYIQVECCSIISGVAFHPAWTELDERATKATIVGRNDRQMDAAVLDMRIMGREFLLPAVSEFSCVGRAVDPVQAIARMKRSPKRMANCALAMHHSRGGMVHSFSDRFKTRNSSFRAASSVGK